MSEETAKPQKRKKYRQGPEKKPVKKQRTSTLKDFKNIEDFEPLYSDVEVGKSAGEERPFRPSPRIVPPPSLGEDSGQSV